VPPLSPPPVSFALGTYLALTAALSPLAPVLLRRRLARGKEDAARLPERLGHPTRPRPDGPLVWFHAASVGESLSLLPLVAAVLDARPDAHALVTSGTRTSADLLATRLPPRARHAFVPLDTPGPVRRFLNHWRPDVAVWTESELWPRLVTATHARAIPMLLVNARMSAASAARWRRAPRMLAGMLARFEAVQAQDAATAELLARHAPDPARIAVAGSLKEGAAPPPAEPGALAALRTSIGARPVWLAASTHPGEEEIVAEAHAFLLRARPDLLLILAPRHPDRAPEVAAILAAAGLAAPRRSTGALPAPDAPAYLADTLGEMGLWYRLAPVAFVGGSLVPVGGHNPYEPAALGATIVTGPHTGNFAEIFARLEAAGGALCAPNADALAAAIATLLDNPAPTRDAARAVATADSGATTAARAAILARLPASDAGAPAP